MKIKASEMERMFHMSPNGIRLYEKHGVMKPQRGGTGGYRTYGQAEVQAMGFGVQQRRYGFSMTETALLIGSADEEAQLLSMERRADELEAEIDRMIRVRKSLKANIQRARRAQALQSVCALEIKPAMYFMATRRGERFEDAQMHELIGAWIDRYAPHLSTGMLLDGQYFTEPGYIKEPLRGVAVDAEAALELGLLPSKHMIYLPPKTCVVTGVAMEDDRIDLEPVVRRVRAYAAEQGLQLHAGGMIRWLQCVRLGDTLRTTGLLYAPLREDEARAGMMK